MSNDLEIFIRDIEKNYPDFMRPQHLVNAGLFKSRSDVTWAIRRGKAPPSIKLSSHKVIFPRAGVCDWLKEKAMWNVLNNKASNLAD